MQVRYANGTNSTSTHLVHVNDDFAGVFKYNNSGWDNLQSTSVNINLKEGINRLTFSKGEGLADIDYITLKKLD